METMRWKEQDIRDNFCHEDAMKILSIPLSACTTTDKRVWRLTKHGFFTVKSAYHAAVATFSNAKGIQASPSRCLKEWKKLWEIKTLPRVKMFLWRACIDAIPTRVNLCRRGSDIDPICPLCGEASETTNHIFLSCTAVKNVWYTSVLRLDISRYSDSSFRHLLWDKLTQDPPEYVALFAYMAWEIWRARNIKCFEDKMFDVMSVQKSAHAKWKEDMEGREIVERNTQSSSIKDARGQRNSMDQMWKTPSAGIKKLNCDAAVGNKGRVGLGFVLRDENGRVLLAGKMECMALGSSTLAEALAMRYALKMVQQYHYTAEIVESDSQVLINNIQGKSTPEIYCELILDDIQRLAREFNCQKFCHIPRSANHVAHLAAHGHEFISIGHTPNHLMASVNADAVSGL